MRNCQSRFQALNSQRRQQTLERISAATSCYTRPQAIPSLSSHGGAEVGDRVTTRVTTRVATASCASSTACGYPTTTTAHIPWYVPALCMHCSLPQSRADLPHHHQSQACRPAPLFGATETNEDAQKHEAGSEMLLLAFGRCRSRAPVRQQYGKGNSFKTSLPYGMRRGKQHCGPDRRQSAIFPDSSILPCVSRTSYSSQIHQAA